MELEDAVDVEGDGCFGVEGAACSQYGETVRWGGGMRWPVAEVSFAEEVVVDDKPDFSREG